MITVSALWQHLSKKESVELEIYFQAPSFHDVTFETASH